MDIVSMWAMKIAQKVAPDEIDQAPFVAEDFVKGGRARKDLFRQAKGGVLGGFGAAEISFLLPWVFHALAVAAPFLYGVLASGATTNAITIVKEIIAALNARKEKQQGQVLPGQQQKPHTQVPPSQPARSNALLEKSADTMTNALRASGRSDEECESITYAVILLLLEDASSDAPSANELIRKITEKK